MKLFKYQRTNEDGYDYYVVAMSLKEAAILADQQSDGRRVGRVRSIEYVSSHVSIVEVAQ